MPRVSLDGRLGVVLLVLATGCAKTSHSTTPESPPTPPSASAARTEPEPVVPCTSDEACAEEGGALDDAGDAVGARAMFEAGCNADGPKSCERWASAVANDDPARALELWEKSCDLGGFGACFNAAEQVREEDDVKAVGLYGKACRAEEEDTMLVSLACSRGALAAYGAHDFGAARMMAEVICDDRMAGGCGLLGVLHAQGLGVPADVDKSKAYLDQGCKAGDEEACENLGKMNAILERERVASVLPVEGANVSIGAITVDGLSASDLQCRRDGGGGLFGGAMGAISGISKRRGKLMKCANEPEDVRVRWTANGGKIESVEVQASTPKVAACVKKSVKGASAAFGGTCAATFSIGG